MENVNSHDSNTKRILEIGMPIQLHIEYDVYFSLTKSPKQWFIETWCKLQAYIEERIQKKVFNDQEDIEVIMP